jgi:DNA-binding transcriptional ArsR family regulator
MNMSAETGGLLSRLWPKKTSLKGPTFSELSESVSVVSETGCSQALPEKVSRKMTKASAQKVKPQKMKQPTIDDLRRVLVAADRTLCIGEIGEALGVSLVGASRVVSEAERAGHVTKKREGKFKFVKLVPLEKLRFSQLR